MLKIKNLIKVRAIWWIVTKLISALNFLVLATELKLLIFKISARTFSKNLSFRKELKLFATIYKYMYYNNLRTKRNSEPWFFCFLTCTELVEVSRKKNGKMNTRLFWKNTKWNTMNDMFGINIVLISHPFRVFNYRIHYSIYTKNSCPSTS